MLSGLRQRYGVNVHIVWVTAHAARPLLEGLVGTEIDELLAVDPADAAGIADLGVKLAGCEFDRILSFDDELSFCALATGVAQSEVDRRVVGAYLASDGQRTYTDAAAAWFDMGLLSKQGKAQADRLKFENTRSHPAIYAEMLGIEPGEPRLELPKEALACANKRLEDAGRLQASPDGDLAGDSAPAEVSKWVNKSIRIGLNTGAGGRWRSKALPKQRVADLAEKIDQHWVARGLARPCFVLLGGPEEQDRNKDLLAELSRARGLKVLDGGCNNGLLEFAALIDGLDVIVTSDSLALHMATARKVPVLAFFAPTSAAEIELYGRGQKVQSTAPDRCSYAVDADTSTLTVERLFDAFSVVFRENLT